MESLIVEWVAIGVGHELFSTEWGEYSTGQFRRDWDLHERVPLAIRSKVEQRVPHVIDWGVDGN